MNVEFRPSVRIAAAFLLVVTTLGAADAPPARKSWKDTKSPLLQADFPFMTTCIGSHFVTNFVPRTQNGQRVYDAQGLPVIDRRAVSTDQTHKGIAIILPNEAFMLFDTDLLRMSAGWTGGYVTTRGVAFDGSHGGHPDIAGDQKFGTPSAPGWADASGSFKDARPEPFGPLPLNQGRYDGIYVVGDKVVITYTVGRTKVYEHPTTVEKHDLLGFVRNFQIDDAKSALAMMVCDVEGTAGVIEKGIATLAYGDCCVTMVGLAGAPKGVELEIQNKTQVVLRIPQGTSAGKFKVVIWKGEQGHESNFSDLLAGAPEMPDFKKGGPARWPEPVVTKGNVNALITPDGSYAVDQLIPPVNNPWRRLVRFGGVDFFPDGKRAALCTWDGDVWIVSGIDEKLEKLTWKRFASGLYEPLGLKIVNGVIHTSGRDQVTRFYDFNNDGEADYYENFNNEVTSSTGFHEFQFDLQADKAGNLYTVKAGPVRGGGRGFGSTDEDKSAGRDNGAITRFSGTLQKISYDGSRREIMATGFRAPNGIGVRADGQVTTSDNEGSWVPTTPIHWVKPGGFYGVEALAHQQPAPEFQKPLCWLSHNGPEIFDNSGGGQVWVTSTNWGPYSGELLHMSYGQCKLYHVLKEQLPNGQMQGGVVQIPVRFTSSAMRGVFNPVDGQLYVAGLHGWQTVAVNVTGFDRIRYTGKPVHAVIGLHVVKKGVELTFSQPLDPASAADLQNYDVKRWNYARTEQYGSPEFFVSNPKQQGREPVNITAAKLSPDGKTLTLEFEDFRPAMQESIHFELKAKDGVTVAQTIQHTIHAIP